MADTKAPAAKKPVTHWACLDNIMGQHSKGDVVPADAWKPGTDFEALQRLGAVRPAAEDEIAEGKADIDPEASKAARARESAAQGEQIRLLQAENAALKSAQQQTIAERGGANPNVPNAGLQKVLQAKDKSIAELTEQTKALEAERASLARQNDDLTKALAEATKPTDPAKK